VRVKKKKRKGGKCPLLLEARRGANVLFSFFKSNGAQGL
jgi:hypothetical protein